MTTVINERNDLVFRTSTGATHTFNVEDLRYFMADMAVNEDVSDSVTEVTFKKLSDTKLLVLDLKYVYLYKIYSEYNWTLTTDAAYPFGLKLTFKTNPDLIHNVNMALDYARYPFTLPLTSLSPIYARIVEVSMPASTGGGSGGGSGGTSIPPTDPTFNNSISVGSIISGSMTQILDIKASPPLIATKTATALEFATYTNTHTTPATNRALVLQPSGSVHLPSMPYFQIELTSEIPAIMRAGGEGYVPFRGVVYNSNPYWMSFNNTVASKTDESGTRNVIYNAGVIQITKPVIETYAKTRVYSFEYILTPTYPLSGSGTIIIQIIKKQSINI